jgi:CBS-domain-containing membrane protein
LHRVQNDEPKFKEESIMATARDLMTKGAECVNSTETLVDAARKMRDLNVGALPICGEDQRLKGMLTDRDIVVKCIAEGKDPNQSEPMTQRKRPSGQWRNTRYAAYRSLTDTNWSASWPRQTWLEHCQTTSWDRF